MLDGDWQAACARVPARPGVAPGDVVFETRNVEPHELRAYAVLRAHGHSFRVLAVDPRARSRGLSSLDIEMHASLWELKCPRGSNVKKTIGRNVNKAISQVQGQGAGSSAKPRIILSALEVNVSADEVVYRVEKKMREGKIDELILILSEADVRYYKKEAEIPIALLRQTGGCLRMSDYTTTTELSEGEMRTLFGWCRRPAASERYAAVSYSAGGRRRRCGRAACRREVRR